MITVVVVPQGGLEVTEATVQAVLVVVGQEVAEGDALFEVETEKSVVDVEAPVAGVVRAIEAAEGDTVAVGATLALLADSADEPLDGAVPAPTAPAPAVAAAAPAPAAAPNGAPRLRAAPVARRAAAELGVVLEDLAGSGPRGRITLDDVRRAAEQGARTGDGGTTVAAPPDPAVAASADTPTVAGDRVEDLPSLRRVIARRMTQSQAIPQYQLVRDLDATALLAQKEAQAARADTPVRIGVNDLLLQALAETVMRHPVLATSFVDEKGAPPRLLRRDGADVGLAVASDRGLVVPVVRRAHELGLAALAEERTRLIAAARAGRLGPDDMAGGALTLSNLGSFGIDRFTAMLNPGESAIAAVGRVIDQLVPRGRGIAVRPTLTLTLSFDHRTVDGADGAAALSTLAGLLEGGMAWRP